MLIFLKQPYSGLDSYYSRLVFVGSLLVVGTFLMMVLNPFNITEWLRIPQWIFIFRHSSLSILSTLVVAFSQFLVRPMLRITHYRIGHLLCTVIVELLCINLLLTLVYGNLNYGFLTEFLNTGKYVLTGIILPYVMALLITHFFNTSNKPKKTQTPLPEMLHFSDEKLQPKFSIKRSSILYLESTANYVWIHYKDASGLQKESIRITLTNIEKQLSEFEFLRCHRSYIVHLPKIQSVTKEVGVYKVVLKDYAFKIPVSRSYEQGLKAYMDNKNVIRPT